VRRAWLLVVVAGCVTAEVTHQEAALVGELEVRHGCTVPSQISALDDEKLRVDACGAPVFYRCWQSRRPLRTCCATTTPPGTVDMFRYETRDYACER
jgi:hypothetical protein